LIGRNLPTDPVGPATDLESTKLVLELEGTCGRCGEAGPRLLRSKRRGSFLEKANFLAQVQMKIRGRGGAIGTDTDGDLVFSEEIG
jgi:hypothetical protein